MKWQLVDGVYRVTISGFMSWKFKSLREGIEWAFISKEAKDVADEMDGVKQ